MEQETSETKTVKSTIFGGDRGNPWDDGIRFDGVVAISIVYDETGKCIESIRVVYDRHGKQIKAGRHGDYGRCEETIEFDYPMEYITKVSGYFRKADWLDGNPTVIQSLKFDTNRKSKSFGKAQANATSFTLPVEAGTKIIGIFGRSGKYLDAIGFHVTAA